MPNFVHGLELSQQFYTEVAKAILATHFPDLRYSAAILAWSSEVLGYDDLESMDHNWGPRFQLFLSQQDYEELKPSISKALSDKLPVEFRGYPTNFDVTPSGDQVMMKRIETGPVKHKIDIEALEGWFVWNLGCSPYKEFRAADWLTLSEQKLLAFTSGKVFHDGLGELETLRRKFSYYPHDVWLYLLVCQWKTIAEEEAFVGRAGFVGDDLGSMVIAARMVKSLMRLCFLMERQYAPYSKWFGSAFSRLKCSAELSPIFRGVLLAESWKEREAYLSRAYETVARLHNELEITEPLNEKVSEHGRRYMVIHGNRFGEAIWQTIRSEEIKGMNFFGGSVNQLVKSDNEVSNAKFCQKLKILYT